MLSRFKQPAGRLRSSANRSLHTWELFPNICWNSSCGYDNKFVCHSKSSWKWAGKIPCSLMIPVEAKWFEPPTGNWNLYSLDGWEKISREKRMVWARNLRRLGSPWKAIQNTKKHLCLGVPPHESGHTPTASPRSSNLFERLMYCLFIRHGDQSNQTPKVHWTAYLLKINWNDLEIT